MRIFFYRFWMAFWLGLFGAILAPIFPLIVAAILAGGYYVCSLIGSVDWPARLTVVGVMQMGVGFAYVGALIGMAVGAIKGPDIAAYRRAKTTPQPIDSKGD